MALAVADGTAMVFVKDHARRRTGFAPRAQTRTKGLTGAALDRALDRWAAKFPDRVH